MDSYPHIIPYESFDGRVHLDVNLDAGTLWLTQDQIAKLYATTKQNVSKHLSNIIETGELSTEQGVNEKLTPLENGQHHLIKFYDLRFIIAVGYKVNSPLAVTFRQWATQTLTEYVTKGFVMDDDRLKGGNNSYFDEWLRRVREIRISERNLWRKVTDIFSTSLDYDSGSPEANKFFSTVQNKFEYAITGKTAAELIAERVSAQKDYLGMTSWKGSEKGGQITVNEAQVGKNYMSDEELQQLGLLTEAFLSLAELRARRHTAMYMTDWNTYLDRYLETQELEVLTGGGKVNRAKVKALVVLELNLYRKQGHPIQRVTDSEIKRKLEHGRDGAEKDFDDLLNRAARPKD
jgi:hypothetical protein